MSTIEEKKRMRLRFVDAIYQSTDGDTNRMASLEAIEPALGLSHDEAIPILTYLMNEGLVDAPSPGGLTLTHRAVVEYEQGVAVPDQPTQHFPPAINIINIGHAEGSMFQQGTLQSTQQSFTLGDEQRAAVTAWIAGVRQATRGLEAEARAEVEAQTSTMEAQARSQHPRLDTMRGAVEAIVPYLKLAGAAAPLIEAAGTLFHH